MKTMPAPSHVKKKNEMRGKGHLFQPLRDRSHEQDMQISLSLFEQDMQPLEKKRREDNAGEGAGEGNQGKAFEFALALAQLGSETEVQLAPGRP